MEVVDRLLGRLERLDVHGDDDAGWKGDEEAALRLAWTGGAFAFAIVRRWARGRWMYLLKLSRISSLKFNLIEIGLKRRVTY